MSDTTDVATSETHVTSETVDTTVLSSLDTSDLLKLIGALDPEEFATLRAATNDRAKNEREAAKTIRLRARVYVQALVTSLTSNTSATDGTPPRVFTNKYDENAPGATGWSLGGSKFTSADGKTYRVSVLVRDESTIPVDPSKVVKPGADEDDELDAS